MKNVHLASLADHAEPSEGDGGLPSGRLRAVTNSPAREYAARAGEVERLPDSVAALILCKVGRARVIRGQIKVTIDGEKMFFTSRDSIIIAAKDGTDEPVLWAINRRAMDVLHLLSDDGAYIESLPRKGEAQWFSQDAASKEALTTAKAHLNRDMDRLRELHAPDTEAAARDAAGNAAQVARLVQTFPAPAAGQSDNPTVGQSGRGGVARAEQFVEAESRIDAQREQRAAFRRGPVADAADFADAEAEEAEETPTFRERVEAPAAPETPTVASAADFC